MKKIYRIICLALITLTLSGAQGDCNVVSIITGGKDPAALDRTDVNAAINNLINFLAGFATTVAVIFIIYGGVLYITSAGGSGVEKAKTTITWSVIGFILILLSYGIVKYILSVLGG